MGCCGRVGPGPDAGSVADRTGVALRQEGDLGTGQSGWALPVPYLSRPGRRDLPGSAELERHRPNASSATQGPDRSGVPLAAGAEVRDQRGEALRDPRVVAGDLLATVGERWAPTAVGAPTPRVCRLRHGRG